MSAGVPASRAPVTSVAEAVVRMEEIGGCLPAADGLACFNRMYLDVTRQVGSRLGAGFFADPESARDAAWNNCLLLWHMRDIPPARKLLCDGLAATAALASRMLLVAV